jgi:galactokinase
MMERFAGTSAQRNVDRVLDTGRAAFGASWAPQRIAIAPGRIEVLGNHLDYNGGPVLAAAIDRFVVTAVGFAPSSQDNWLFAADEQDARTQLLGDPATPPSSPPQTSDYVRGVIAELVARGQSAVAGAQIVVAGDVPIGFGVSSSAALCVSLTLALADAPLVDRDVVLVAQAAEHRAGSPCGTMDQSASVAGGVIDFDGASLHVSALSPQLGDYVFAVADSGVSRSLGTSSYPTRVAECREALEIARRELQASIPHLAAITPDQLAQLETSPALSPTLVRRVRHVVEETARVAQGRRAVQDADWARFGRLMTESGSSSATLYEISHPEVEDLVAVALQQPGVLGARMMGGGEGGAVLALLRRDAVETFEAGLRDDFYRSRGRATDPGLVHICAFAPGASLLTGKALPENSTLA